MTTIIFLRLVHILFGVFWVGTAIFVNFILFPALKGDPATMGKIAGTLTQRGMHKWMGIAAVLTLLSGFGLVWIMSGGDMAAYNQGPGKIFTMAGGLGTLAFLLGLLFARPAGLKAGEIGQALAAATDPAEKARLQGEMAAIQKKTALITMSVVVLLLLAVAGMAVARYV
jgi:uncharacterized membrane protein